MLSSFLWHKMTRRCWTLVSCNLGGC